MPVEYAPLESLHPLLQHHYFPIECVGSGGHGSVLKVERASDGSILAVKMIPKRKLPPHRLIKVEFPVAKKGECTPPGLAEYSGSVRDVPVEAYVLRRIIHHGIVQFVDLFDDDEYFYLVQEYAGDPWEGGDEPEAPISPTSSSSGSSTSSLRSSSSDLYQCLHEHTRLSEPVARFIFAQLVIALIALKRHGIAHCDIKDQNVLITRDFRVKMIDFGAASVFNAAETPKRLRGLIGTRRFSAPEVFTCDSWDPLSADLWSLGIVLCLLLTGETPYPSGLPRRKISKDARRLLMRLLATDPERRGTIEDCLNDEWLRGMFA